MKNSLLKLMKKKKNFNLKDSRVQGFKGLSENKILIPSNH